MYKRQLQGSITQLKTCTAELINFGKRTSIPVMLIGHINKDGNIAGPKVLEHMVDTYYNLKGIEIIYTGFYVLRKIGLDQQMRLEFMKWFQRV